MLEQFRLDIHNGTKPNPMLPNHPVYYYECDVYDQDLEIARVCGETWQDNPHIMNLQYLGVNPEYRTRMIGYTLLSMFLEWAFTTPAEIIRINTGGVPLDDNPTGVIQWYEEHFGFYQVEVAEYDVAVLELPIK